MATTQEDIIVERVVSRLEGSIGDAITENIKSNLQAIVKKEFELVNKRLDSISGTATDINENLEEDRKGLGEMNSHIAGMEQDVKTLISINKQQTKTIVSKVSIELEKVPETVISEVNKTVPAKARQGVKEYIEMIKPKVVQVVEKVNKPWWKFGRG